MDDELKQSYLSPYENLVTSEHQKPKFLQTIDESILGHVETQALLARYVDIFDVDQAVGQQLDFVGQWVGVSRFIETLIENIYFSWDTEGVGWDQGIWWSPYQPTTSLATLDDEHYRILLKARIIANNWDGTIPSAYTAWDSLFESEGYHIIIQNGMAAVVHEFKFDAYDWEGWDQASWGQFVEPHSNFIRNSTMVGAAVGFPSETLPTYWSYYGGLNFDVASIYVWEDIDVMNLVFHGNTIDGETNIFFDQNLVAHSNEIWTLSIYFQVLDDNPFLTAYLQIRAYSINGALLSLFSKSLDTSPTIFHREYITCTTPNNTAYIRVLLSYTHSHAQIIDNYSFLIGNPQLEFNVTTPTDPIKTKGSATVVHVPEIPEIRLNGGMHMMYGLIAPYSAPPTPPDYFTFDDYTYHMVGGDWENQRTVGIPIFAVSS